MNISENNKIKLFKLHILQKRYKYLTEIILRLEKHIDFLFLSNVLDFNQKNQILGNIFVISKNLNTSYNNFIIDKLDNKHLLDIKITELINLFEVYIDNNFLIDKMINILKKYIKFLKKTFLRQTLAELRRFWSYSAVKILSKICTQYFSIYVTKKII